MFASDFRAVYITVQGNCYSIKRIFTIYHVLSYLLNEGNEEEKDIDICSLINK